MSCDVFDFRFTFPPKPSKVMCGIVGIYGNKILNEKQLLIQTNSKRGPDASKTISFSIDSNSNATALNAEFHGNVLHLCGKSIQPQPVVDQFGNILLFNGQIYQYKHVDFQRDQKSDSLFLLKLLAEAGNVSDNHVALADILGNIKGEWALCYYTPGTKCLYFARDFLGRRSLLWHIEPDLITIASVGCGSPDFFQEVPCTGLFKINLDASFDLKCVTWDSVMSMPKNIINMDILDTDLHVQGDGSFLPDCSHVHPEMISSTGSLLRLLSKAVERRVSVIPFLNQNDANDAKLGILFSGGLDCMILAALASKYLAPLQPIDLLNVSFENPRSLNAHNRKDKFDTPDRNTGLKGWQELCKLYPEREWRFVNVNVEYTKVLEFKQHIINLMNPLDTVMDLSIAMAFWFAARGIGYLKGSAIEYKSTARVLLSGLGADEQLGGYSRHRKAFERGGWSELAKEVALDVGRISTRNLGRDDRVIADHGREVRFPYLDENVVSFLSSLSIQVKTDPRYDRSVGDKMLLRFVAKELGLNRASCEPKRAVQFGARTAKMDFKFSKGHERL